MSETYRSYNSFIPNFLRGRPRSVIIHCLQRMKKSLKFMKTNIDFSNEMNGLFHLKSHSGKVHVVDFGVMTNTPSCTCKDWIQFRIPCKHFFAIFEHSEQWKWGALPKHYLESSHITADVKAFDNQYPTVSDTTPNTPLDLVYGADDPPIPNTSKSTDTVPVCAQDLPSDGPLTLNTCNSTDIMPVCGQDLPSDDPLTLITSNSADIAPACGQDIPSTFTHEDSNSCNSAALHNQVLAYGFHECLHVQGAKGTQTNPCSPTKIVPTCSLYMFRAICKFTQFRNCAAQIRNCKIVNQFRNCATTFAHS